MSTVSHIGKFKLIRKLGEGGMGKVFEGIQPDLDRHVAIKVLPRTAARNDAFIERFKREAKAAASLNHPNIVTIYDIGEDQGFHYFSMELVTGQTLEERLREHGPISPSDAIDLMQQALQGLAHAWASEIIHRDLKPANLLLSETGMLKIADFGLAKWSNELTGFTNTGASMGTLHYMSPEQGNNAKSADHRSDIYSLGATFYHLLSGRVPFEASSPFEAAVKISSEPLEPIRNVNPDVPEHLAITIEKMMAKKPEDRFADAEQILDALHSQETPVNGDTPKPPSPEPGGTEPATIKKPNRSASRTRRNSILGSSIFVMFAAIGVTVLRLNPMLTIDVKDTPASGLVVEVKTTDETVAHIGAESGWSVRLPPGTYRLEPVGIDADKFIVDPSNLSLEKTAKPVVLRRRQKAIGLSITKDRIVENSQSGDSIGELLVDDPDLPHDHHTFRVIEETDGNVRFQIVGTELQVADHWNTNFENPNEQTRQVRIEATDSAGLTSEHEFTIHLEDLQEPPNSITLNGMQDQHGWIIAPETKIGEAIGTVAVADEDNDGVRSLTLDVTETRFAIEDGKLILKEDLRTGIHQLNLHAVDSTELVYDVTVQVHVYGRQSFLYKTGTLRRPLAPEDILQINDVEFSPDGNQLLSAGEDGSVRTWDVGKLSQAHATQHPGSRSTRIAWSPDGTEFAVAVEKLVASEGTVDSAATTDAEVKVYRLGSDSPTRRLSTQGESVTCLTYLDDRRLAAGCGNGSIIVWNSDAEPIKLSGDSGSIQSIVFHANRLVSSSSAGQVRHWNIETQESQPSSIAPNGQVLGVSKNDLIAVSSGSTISVSHANHILRGYSQPLTELQATSSSNHTKLGWSNDEKFLIAGNEQDLVVWRIRVGAHDQLSQYVFGGTTRFAVSPIDRFVATAECDGQLHLYEVTDRVADDSINTTIFVPPTSEWRYLPNNQTIPDDWNQPSCDDSNWNSGQAMLGFGDDARLTTVLTKHDSLMSVVFRRTFQVQDTDLFRDLMVGLVFDDGVAVYLNGHEIIRENLLPNAAINAAAVGGHGDFSEYQWRYFKVDPQWLRRGENTLATEVHQNGPGSSDITFQLMLVGNKD
ncbi:protein kinase [Planctomycetota bacterium]